MKYLEIKKLLADNGLECSISLDIVGSLMASLCSVDEEVSDDYFVALCGYIRHIWDHINHSYTQLVADIVVDCVYHCFGYSQCEDIQLGYYDLVDLKETDKVIEVFCDKYYDAE